MITNRIGLKSEIQNDPVSIGYASKTASEILVLLTAQTQIRNRGPVSGQEVLAQIDNGELTLLNNSRIDALVNFLASAEEIDLHDPNVVTVLGKFFTAGSISRANLLSFRRENISRLEVISIGDTPTLHQVEVANG